MTLHRLQSANGFLSHIRENLNVVLVSRAAILYFHDLGLAKSLFPTSPIMLQPCCPVAVPQSQKALIHYFPEHFAPASLPA